MSKKIKIILILIIAFTIATIFSNVYAASANITAGSTKIEVGKSTTITASVSATEAWNLKLTSSGGTLSGTTMNADAAGAEVSQNVISATFTASAEGTYNITLSGQVTGSDLVKQPVSKTITITVVAPVKETPSTSTTTPSTGSTSSSSSSNKPSSSSSSNKPTTTTKPAETKKSDNSKLESLQIAEGTITPEFSSSVKEYAINLPNEITKLSISAVTDSSRATVSITGNEELQVGENKIQVIVTAEDGSKTTYTILATRADKQLSLQSLNVYYIDENGEKVVLPLEPVFVFDTYEYTLEKLKHTVKSLEIEAIANKENAKVEITGNEEIKAGKNEITIKVTLMNEEGLEEVKTYKIIVEREEEPVVVPLTTMQKIKNWFSGVGVTISKWATANFDRIISGMLLMSTATFIGLTIYFVYDYKNYQKLIAKLAAYNKESLMERANIALNPEMAEDGIIEETENIEEIEKPQEISEEQEEKPKAKLSRGRRFK